MSTKAILPQYDLEVTIFEKAVKISPDKYEYWYDLGTAYEDILEYDKAVEAYHYALRLKPDHKDALHDFAILSMADGNCDRASKLISKLKESDPGQAKKLEFLMRRACR